LRREVAALAHRVGKLVSIVMWRLILLLAVLLVLALASGAALGLRVRRSLEARSSRKRTRRGLDAEAAAEKLLRRQGYRVLGRQVRKSYDALVDGESFTVELSADYLVSREGVDMVVEVKTGDGARLRHADTRRQMLEYQLAFAVNAVILLDADRGTLKRVTFPLAQREQPSAPMHGWLGYAVALACAGALWWKLVH
jgi:hypothetical protein